jgi:hypothetical protein
MNIQRFLLLLTVLCLTQNIGAKTNIGEPAKHTQTANKTDIADCNPATAQVELNINNVRTTLLTGGDLWWDPVGQLPKYEVPKIPIGSNELRLHSIYAGALWIGGIDQATGALKVAAQTYRQTGNDFFPGPLNDNGQTDAETCNNFDRMWTVYGSEIAEFIAKYEDDNSVSLSEVPDNLLKWPGRNNPYFSDKNPFDLPEDKIFAPFYDRNGDDAYNPLDGDYPVIDPSCEPNYADQMIWWMFNDRGNSHTESGGEAIGLEVGALAFAFQTNDETNNMTFYRYEVDNRSTTPLDKTYFGQWVDPDLGEALDDFVGCSPENALGVVYNGDANDEGNYGNDVPMLGIDFFKGPKEKIGNNPDGTPIYQQLGMSAFVYYNNNFGVQGNPENASHYYGYLSGFWKDGTPFTYGGIGKGGSTPYPYMFPSEPNLAAGTTDPATNLEAWSECAAGNTPDDRRFLQSSGPFLLEPGAINEIVVGVVWTRGATYPCPSYQLLLNADKKAQALFDNCFKLIDGPDAPDLLVRELNQELVLGIWNDSTRSNNKFESYAETDPVLAAQSIADSIYTFEGYKVFQLVDETVSPSEYTNVDKARLVAVIDVKNGIKRLINYEFDASIGALIPTIKVQAEDIGIGHSLNIKEDLFATGDKQLINNKAYFYSVLAYAYNDYQTFNPAEPAAGGQLVPYLEGRNNIKKYKAMPHIPVPQQDGIVLNSKFGDGPEVKQIDGFGSAGNDLELIPATVEEILSNGKAEDPIYASGQTPVMVKIFDPFKVPNAKFELTINNTLGQELVQRSRRWQLRNLDTGQEYFGERTLNDYDEQAVGGWEENSLGFTIAMQQQDRPSGSVNGHINSSLIFTDNQKQWLAPIQDQDGTTFFNWIRSGSFASTANSEFNDNATAAGVYFDPNQYYATMIDGRIAPYCLANVFTTSSLQGGFPLLAPGCSDCYGDGSNLPNTLSNMRSVDIVYTADKTKWTKCPVIEMAKSTAISQGKSAKNSLRNHPSWDKDTNGYENGISGNVQSGTTYFVHGTSASFITYTDASGATKTVNAFKYFTPDANSAFVANNGAQVYNSANVGYSWFPGYAINVETGERLNMMFSENSFLGTDNGDDMIWNPTSRTVTPTFGPSGNNFRFGGEHYIYVMTTKYDQGQAIHEKLVQNAATSNIAVKNEVYNDCMYVSTTMLTPGFELKSVADGIIPVDARMRVRISNPYQIESADNNVLKYQFDMGAYAAQKQQTELAKNALDLVQVVPNPYYGFSKYETSSLDNRVRITNLPTRAKISIFTLEGTVIHTINVDNTGLDTALGDETTNKKINSVDWNMTNFKNIPIASGVYLIHIDAPDLGVERTIKWFCINRPIDLDVF